MPKLKPLSQENEILSEAETSRQEAEKAKADQEVNKQRSGAEQQFVDDVQLPPARSKNQSETEEPDEIGFVSRFPVIAYVMSYFYGFIIIFLGYFTYLAYQEQEVLNGTEQGDLASMLTPELLSPSLSIVVALFLMLTLLGGSKILRWLGFVASIAAFVYVLFEVTKKVNDISSTIVAEAPFTDKIAGYADGLFATDLWVFVLGLILLAMTAFYSVLPKYKVAYR